MKKISIEEMINYLIDKKCEEREHVKFYIYDDFCEGLEEINIVDILNDEISYGMGCFHNSISDMLENNDKIYMDDKIDIYKQVKLSTAERIILENFNKKWKYIARDLEKGLYLYGAKPKKYDTYWNSCSAEGYLQIDRMFSSLFTFIEWEDEEPYEIEELLKGE